jgi:hypothetical protein
MHPRGRIVFDPIRPPSPRCLSQAGRLRFKWAIGPIVAELANIQAWFAAIWSFAFSNTIELELPCLLDGNSIIVFGR